MVKPDGTIPLAEAARQLRVTHKTAYDMMCLGEMRSERVGARYYVDVRDVRRIRRQRGITDEAR